MLRIAAGWTPPATLNHIEQQTTQSGATDSGEFMINRVVEIDEESICNDFPLPS
jgi:hypothetical protein